MKKYSFIIIALIAILSIKCTKEDNEQLKTESLAVMKGDSISKDIYREKPESEGVQIVELFSSEKIEKSNSNLLKSVAPSTGTLPVGDVIPRLKSAGEYVTNLYIVTSDYSTAQPPWPYTRIEPTGSRVDLNEGSGGKWIFLSYTKEIGQDPIRGLKVWAGPRYPNPTISSPWEVASNSNGFGYPGADLNEGAGGDWIYLYVNSSVSCGSPIKEIAVVSTTSSSYSPCCGWEIVNTPGGKVDLNKGASGKYIYIIYKK